MALHDEISKLRQATLASGKVPVPATYQGVSKKRIADVLARIDRSNPDIVDAVFALLDDQQPSWFSKAPEGARFCDGASTAQIGCHIGIWQRGKGKLDREGRDYWLKPLWEIGAIEKVYLDAANSRFLDGHPVAKSANSAYRLSPSFTEILTAPEGQWQSKLDEWNAKEAIRERLALQARLHQQSVETVSPKHQALINAVVEHYASRFLPGFKPIYVDDSDGDRFTTEERSQLADAGIELGLDDAAPDVLLWNKERNELWVVEAVTSDGEVDSHKVSQMRKVAARAGMTIGFTTAYDTWRTAASRQGKHKNIPPDTYIWIAEDPSKHLKVEGT